VDALAIETKTANQGSNASNEDALLASFKKCDTCAHPDIYLIVMDEYWGTDMLIKNYGYDNHSFISFLTKNGFDVL
jgi:hypothetical protein